MITSEVTQNGQVRQQVGLHRALREQGSRCALAEQDHDRAGGVGNEQLPDGDSVGVDRALRHAGDWKA
jgi:hypothetical protein